MDFTGLDHVSKCNIIDKLSEAIGEHSQRIIYYYSLQGEILKESKFTVLMKLFMTLIKDTNIKEQLRLSN